jgi:uncharacterized protein YbjT (DUF2867 family)
MFFSIRVVGKSINTSGTNERPVRISPAADRGYNQDVAGDVLKTILLTGATGFVGRALEPALAAAGWKVRCLTRDGAAARAGRPDLDWVEGNLERPEDCARVLRGSAAAVYLVHGMGDSADYLRRESEVAHAFARSAADAGLERIVYLGGIEPSGEPSLHLRSRLAVGEALRAGAVSSIELRASMIIGDGSLSWLIVRDLAARLPVMVLPSWMRSRTEPVAIDDVLVALVAATRVQMDGADGADGVGASPHHASFDLPGPEQLSCRQILEQTARLMGLRPPRTLELPFLSPRLSSHWVRFVTRARWAVAREVVLGLEHDMLARDDTFWSRIGHPGLLSFSEAARRALAAESAHGPVPGRWGRIERARKRHAFPDDDVVR